MDIWLKYFLFIIIVKKPQNGLKFREIVANSSLIIPHIILLQFELILGAVTPKNSSCPNLGKGVSSKSNLKKAYWIILFLIGTYYTILNVIVTFQDYFQYEVTTDTALSFEKSVPFPAISICNLNR